MVKQILQTSKGQLQFEISGNGETKIVLINGGSGPIEGWMKIMPKISESARVFAYNRFGVAGSDKPKEPQDGITIVETLREALSKANFEPPYLLVGHSLGGLYAQLFARLYPEEAAAIVFIESSTPQDLHLNEKQSTTVKTINKLFSFFDSLSSHKQFDETLFVKDTAEQIATAPAFPDIPVYVITGGKENKMMPEDIRRQRLENQLELLSLSKKSTHVIAEKSGHFPQLTEPETVVSTIRDCLEQLHTVNS